MHCKDFLFVVFFFDIESSLFSDVILALPLESTFVLPIRFWWICLHEPKNGRFLQRNAPVTARRLNSTRSKHHGMRGFSLASNDYHMSQQK